MSKINDDGRTWPCSINDKGYVQPCWAMAESLEDNFGRGTRAQGLKLVSLVNTRTHEGAGSMIICKSGGHSKRGMTMNWCPFCGGWIRKNKTQAEFIAEVEAAKAEDAARTKGGDADG